MKYLYMAWFRKLRIRRNYFPLAQKIRISKILKKKKKLKD